MDVFSPLLKTGISVGLSTSLSALVGSRKKEEENVLFSKYDNLSSSPLCKHLEKLSRVDSDRCWQVYECVDFFLSLDKDGNRGCNTVLMNRTISVVETELNHVCKQVQKSRDEKTAICAIEYLEEDAPALLYCMETILRNTLLKDRF